MEWRAYNACRSRKDYILLAFAYFLTIETCAVRKVGVELIVLFFGHNVCVLMVCSTRLQR